MKLLMVIALLAAACSKKSGGGSDCDAATSRGVDQTIAKRRGSQAGEMSPEEKKVPEKLKVVLAKACVDDKWSTEVVDCFKTAEDIATCKEKLTPEQRASYTRNVMQVMMGSRGATGMPHGGGPMMGSGAMQPPPSGSDVPPAGSAPPPAGSTPPAGAGSN